MSDDEYTPVPKRPDPVKTSAADRDTIDGDRKPLSPTANKDPEDIAHTNIPRNNSQLRNTARFNSEVTPEEYPKEDRQAGQVTQAPKK